MTTSPNNLISFVDPNAAAYNQAATDGLQRQQALADALRQQSLAPIDSGQGQVSWTQGLAKLAQAVAANRMNRRNQATEYDISTRNANALRAAYGSAPLPQQQNPYATGEQGRGLGQRIGDFVRGGPPVATQSPQDQPTPQQAPQPSPQADPRATLTAAMASAPGQGSGQPQPSPQAGSPPPSASGMGQGGYPFALSGDASKDIPAQLVDNEDYMKAYVGRLAERTDAQKAVAAAGIDPDSPQARAMLGDAAQGATGGGIEVDRRGYAVKKNTGQIVGFHPDVGPGQQPIGDASGNVTGAAPIPGYAANEQQIAAAKALGGAAGELVTVTGPDGAQFQVPKSTMLGGGGATQPGATAPGVGGSGALGRLYGGGSPTSGNQSAPAPAVAAASAESGRNSANQFNSVISGGANAKQAMFKFDQIAKELQGVATGPGAVEKAERIGAVNTWAPHIFGRELLPNPNLDRIQSAAKSARDLALSLSASTGGARGATDARLATALGSITDPDKAPGAITTLTPILKSYQAAALGKAQAAATWEQRHGHDDYHGFEKAWQQNDSPELFYQLQQGPQALAKLPPAQRADLLGKYRALKSLGAF